MSRAGGTAGRWAASAPSFQQIPKAGKFKVGDLVRTGRYFSHGLPFGFVGEVVGYSPATGSPLVGMPGGGVLPVLDSTWNEDSQAVGWRYLTIAKQAMRKRGAYANRRG